MDFSRLFKGAVKYFLKILRKWCLSVVELPVSMWTKYYNSNDNDEWVRIQRGIVF